MSNLHRISAESRRIVILSARFNLVFTERLIEGARKAFFGFKGKEQNLTIYSVPGAFELPFACAKLLDSEDIDGLVVLGVVLKGDTKHNETLVTSVSNQISKINARGNIPLGFGLLECDNIEQVKSRTSLKVLNNQREIQVNSTSNLANSPCFESNKGYEAMLAVLECCSFQVTNKTLGFTS